MHVRQRFLQKRAHHPLLQIYVIVLSLFSAFPAAAEVVRLKSGMVLQGRILEETDQALVIDVGDDINVRFLKTQIAAVEPSVTPAPAAAVPAATAALTSSSTTTPLLLASAALESVPQPSAGVRLSLPAASTGLPAALPDIQLAKATSVEYSPTMTAPEVNEILPRVAPLVRWMKRHVSPATQLPFSFSVPADAKKTIYSQIGKADTVCGVIERSIVAEGLEIYDGALWQIVLTSLGGPEDVRLASKPVELYWEGQLGSLMHVRAGFPGQPYIYDPNQINTVSADIDRKGERGFIFRIINANGNYNMSDPLDGKTVLEGFPTWPRLHWEDWKPIAGENAWVAMAALHVFHRKYYDRKQHQYTSSEKVPELLLAEELTRAALVLQADNGGIRMAPLGTYHNNFIDEEGTSADKVDPQSHRLEEYMRQTERLARPSRRHGEMWDDISSKFPAEYLWYYEEISTENNLSWYAALRMLYQVTKKEEYQEALGRIRQYLQTAWDEKENVFYQGMHYQQGGWVPNRDHFATDVQTWSIAVIGPQQLDEWLGLGTAAKIWQQTKKKAGYFDEQGVLRGVGFTAEHDRLSVEWTGGAILAAQTLAAYYQDTHPDWAQEAAGDAATMRQGIEQFRQDLGQDGAAYSYSSRRGWIPFGWFSHIPQVTSLASTSWVVLVDQKINPFVLSTP